MGIEREWGMRNAECGMRNGEQEMVSFFRIPHSAFRIPLLPMAVLFCRGERGDFFVRAPLFAEYPDDADAQEIEGDHRRGEDDHI